MPESRISTFDSAEGFSLPVPGVHSELTVLGSGPFTAKIVRVKLDGLWLLRGTESGARILKADSDVRRIAVIFQTHPGSEMFWNGAQVEASSLAVMEPGR